MGPQILIGILIIFAIRIFIYFISKKRSIKNIKLNVEQTIPDVIQDQEIIQIKVIKEEPEIKKINSLVDKYLITQNPFLLIKIGDFWRKGVYPRIKADNAAAIKYYELAASSNNKIAAEIATTKYIEAIRENIPKIDNIGQQLNDIYFEAVEAATRAATPRYQQFDIEPNHIAEQIIEEAPIERPRMVFLNDGQNVHDHYLNKITKTNIDKLKEKYGEALEAHLEDPTRIIEILKDNLYRDSGFNTYQKAAINNVIISFSDQNKQFECSELDALFLVYRYIIDQSNKNDLFHNLFLQLMDCYYNGFVVCTTGKISRVISVVGDLEGFENARNIYYIKDELERLASRVRKDVLKTLTPEQVNDYNTGGNESDRITEEIKNKYRNVVQEEYCAKLGIDYNIILPHVEANMLGF